MFFTNLAALGFGTTVVPGIALADPSGNGYINYIIAHAVAIVAGFFMTLILGKFMDQPEPAAQPKQITETKSSAPSNNTNTKSVVENEPIYGYAEGQVIPLEQVNDATFANKVLGDGIAVIPEKGEVYAPVDGTVVSIFDTKHAIGIQSANGTELLIHIGIDTVNLNGKYFKAHVKTGDSIKKGQLMISFEKDKIKKEGYDTVIPLLFTDLSEDKQLTKLALSKMTKESQVAIIQKK